MVIITENNINYLRTYNDKEIKKLIKVQKKLMLNCLGELSEMWNLTKYDIYSSAYNKEIMQILMDNLYKNYFYVRRNHRKILKRFEKERHLKEHQLLKEMGEIDSEDEDSF